ncbi:MAG TPA: hypothetical protein VNP37_21305 [Actinomycetospora sp.]|nr:hypothetical protein [Actinomycetospora sp.]
MIVGLTSAVLVLALAWALWCAVSAALGQAPTIRHRIGLLVLEAVALVQALVLVVGLFVEPGRSAGAVVEIVGYLIATLVALPIGAALAHGERTRYGSLVLAVAGITLAVLSLRTGQVWTVTRAL